MALPCLQPLPRLSARALHAPPAWRSYSSIAARRFSPPSCRAEPQRSSAQQTSDVFNYEGHTLSSLYIGKQPQIQQLDHLKRRQARDIAEIAEVRRRGARTTCSLCASEPQRPMPWARCLVQAGRRFGLTEATIQENLATLQTLLPDLAPNLDRMKAADWVRSVLLGAQAKLLPPERPAARPGAGACMRPLLPCLMADT